jgi:hypothetical protein
MATVILAAKYTSPLTVGNFVFQPRATYDQTVVDFSDPLIVAAIDRGDIVFNDGVNTVTSMDADPGAQVAEANAVAMGVSDPNAPIVNTANLENDNGVIAPGTQLPQ